MTEQQDAIQRETAYVAWTALAISFIALAYGVRHGTLLLYGDAVAHLHIARRVVDSITPGYRQLGSVWLPLPHILLIPFVANMAWWRSGLAGAFLSIPSYVLASAGIYRLARIWLGLGASLAVVCFFSLNPGLVYFSTTAMTEPLFLAEMIWAVVLIVQFQQAEAEEDPAAPRLLLTTGLVLVCAIFTRYDGWVYAAAAWLFATWPLLTGRRNHWKSAVAGAWVLFTALLIAAPSLWLAYNAKQFHDPLDFMRGPYSAKAIEAKTTPPGSQLHPGVHNMHVSGVYFLKAAELGAIVPALGPALCWLSAAGTLAAFWVFRRQKIWPLMLLWFPLPFYACSVAYGSVPIFIPIWQPYSWYNTRYGMELLPAFALFLGCLISVLLVACPPRWRRFALPGVFLLIAGNSFFLLRARPLVYQEAVANSGSRIAFETALGKVLSNIPLDASILMHVSNDVGAVQYAGIPLHRIINEGDYLTWQHALADPAHSASAIVALDGDAVAQAIQRHPDGLQMVNVVCSTGQPCARIYRSQFRSR